jgi:hypothetical protein
MSFESPGGRRFGRPRFGSLRDHLLAEIDALAIELEEAGEATLAGHAPLSARDNYLRARDAHHRAAIAWMGATNPAELSAVSEALRQCRTALESSRALLRP